MDPLTATHYAANVTESTAKYETLAPGSGINAGSGRDLNLLLSTGYDAYGVDASLEMVSQALKDHPALSGRFIEGSLPANKAIFGGDFDGILCSAVLRFTLEADRLIGRHVGPNWQSSLFCALSDAIEITSLQRGVERWNI